MISLAAALHVFVGLALNIQVASRGIADLIVSSLNMSYHCMQHRQMELREGELLRGIVEGFAAAYDALRPASAFAPAATPASASAGCAEEEADGLSVAQRVRKCGEEREGKPKKEGYMVGRK